MTYTTSTTKTKATQYDLPGIEDKVMTILVISISSDSSEDSVGTPAGRVILFETPIIAPTIPPSPDYTPVLADYHPVQLIQSLFHLRIHHQTLYLPITSLFSPFFIIGCDTTDSEYTDTPPHYPLVRTFTVSDVYLSILQLFYRSTSAGPSRQGRRSPMTYVPALSPVSGALSHIRADLIPSPKRVKDSGYLADVEVDHREISLRDDAIVRDRGIDARVVVKAVDRDETEIGVRGPVKREQGYRIVGVESAVIALTERIAELERDNKRVRGTASVESQRLDRLQRGMSRMQRELRQIRRLRFYDRVRVGRLEACARKHMDYRP
ncbi:hypothetical protein Tco_0983259 [Tanacetum coccineum]